MKRVAIVGLGLLGGSIALALRELDGETTIAGVDLPQVIGSAAAARVAHELFEIEDLERAVAASDLVVLATPVAAIVDLLPRVLAHAAQVTDCGSTKRAIVARAASCPHRDRFVPGHPMAGGPEGGADLARADLFRGRRWLLCPEGASTAALAAVTGFVRSLGAEPVELTADAHDRAVALTSHVPQLVASALAALAAERGANAAAGPSFEAATRAASANTAIWRDIFATNGDEIAGALESLVAELNAVRSELAAGSAEAALELLARVRRS